MNFFFLPSQQKEKHLFSLRSQRLCGELLPAFLRMLVYRQAGELMEYIIGNIEKCLHQEILLFFMNWCIFSIRGPGFLLLPKKKPRPEPGYHPGVPLLKIIFFPPKIYGRNFINVTNTPESSNIKCNLCATIIYTNCSIV